MIDYLSKYNVSEGDLEKIKETFNKDIINKFAIMQSNVEEVLTFLKENGINNYIELILNRPDICFIGVDILKEKLNKFNPELIKFIFENEVDNLINFDL